jgi:hypothetical protein
MKAGAIPAHQQVPKIIKIKKSAALAKLQNAVRSKKFDFIKHVMKQFERIRDGGVGEERGAAAEGGLPGAAAVAPGRAAYGTRAAGDPSQEHMSASAKRRAIDTRSASSSSDNYEQPEDFTKDPSKQNTIRSETNAVDKKEDASSKSSRSAAVQAGRSGRMSSS